MKYFRSRVALLLSDVTGTSIPSLPNVLLLNDDSVINVTKSQRSLTAAKKLLVLMWKPPHKLQISQWILQKLDQSYPKHDQADQKTPHHRKISTSSLVP